jgi:hypothetical protein
LRLHAAKVTTVAQKLKSDLTWYYYEAIDPLAIVAMCIADEDIVVESRNVAHWSGDYYPGSPFRVVAERTVSHGW